LKKIELAQLEKGRVGYLLLLLAYNRLGMVQFNSILFVVQRIRNTCTN